MALGRRAAAASTRRRLGASGRPGWGGGRPASAASVSGEETPKVVLAPVPGFVSWLRGRRAWRAAEAAGLGQPLVGALRRALGSTTSLELEHREVTFVDSDGDEVRFRVRALPDTTAFAGLRALELALGYGPARRVLRLRAAEQGRALLLLREGEAEALQVAAPQSAVDRGDVERVVHAAEALGMLPNGLKGFAASHCVEYLTSAVHGCVEDEHAHAHFAAGAALHSVHWRADESPSGLASSLGIMAGYVYDAAAAEGNRKNYALGSCPIRPGGVLQLTASRAQGDWPEARTAGLRPTEEDVIAAVIELLRPLVAGRGQSGVLFADLGSGDGSVVNAVVRALGCRGVGVELEDGLVGRSRAAAAELPERWAGRSRFICADMNEVDLGEVGVLFLYLPHSVLRQVVSAILPNSGLRMGAKVLVEGTPEDFLNPGIPELKHLQGGFPAGERRPRLDLFEWRADASGARERDLIPVWGREC